MTPVAPRPHAAGDTKTVQTISSETLPSASTQDSSILQHLATELGVSEEQPSLLTMPETKSAPETKSEELTSGQSRLAAIDAYMNQISSGATGSMLEKKMKVFADELRTKLGQEKEKSDCAGSVEEEKGDDYWSSVAKTGKFDTRSAAGQAFSKGHRPGSEAHRKYSAAQGRTAKYAFSYEVGNGYLQPHDQGATARLELRRCGHHLGQVLHAWRPRR